MMKRFIGIWILILACFFPVHTFAQDTNKIEGGWIKRPVDQYAIEKSSLEKVAVLSDESVAKLTADLEKALLQRKTAFTIQYSGDTSDLEGKIDQAVKSVLMNNEYLNYDFRGYSYSGQGTSDSFSISFTATYYQTAEQVTYVDQKIEQILADIITPDMNAHEKVKAVHDYIVEHVKYDTTYNQDVNAPYFALTEGKTLCNGYAMLMYQMLTKLDIPVRLISGTAGGEGHAWNLVQLDGEWYHLDATWDDPVPDVEGRFVYNYYLVSDKMIADDHSWQEGGLNGNEKAYPTATADYAAKLSTLGYDELAKSLNLQYFNPEFTSKTDEEFVNLVSSYFNKMAGKFSIRFVTTDDHISEKLGELIEKAASQTDTHSWTYSRQAYSRSEETDYIVTISDIDYVRKVRAIKMLTLPERALTSGEKMPLLVSATLSDGTQMNVTDQAMFTVHDPNIAAVNSGNLTAKDAGSTTITVSFQGQETSFQVDVEKGKEEIPYPMAGYKPFGEQSNVDSEKVWTVKFNTDIDRLY